MKSPNNPLSISGRRTFWREPGNLPKASAESSILELCRALARFDLKSNLPDDDKTTASGKRLIRRIKHL